MRTMMGRFACAIAVLSTMSAASAQILPAVGSKVSGKLVVGRNTIVFPPGEWEVIWTGEGAVGTTGEGAKNPAARLLAAQTDEERKRVRSVLFHISTMVSTPGVNYWNTGACETTSSLYKDFSGNFKFPECLIIDYWMAPNSSSKGTEKSLFDWTSANNLKLPAAFVVARYVKYKGGDYMQTHVSVNPDAFGLPESTSVKRDESEWNASKLKVDAVRSAYIEMVKKWGHALAEQAGPTVGGGSSSVETLPPLPQTNK